MLNQVTIEGFLVSRWRYKGEAFLRIAYQRPQRQHELIHSDYLTIRVDRAVKDLPNLQQGDLVRVTGEVCGKDILEPLGQMLQKARLNVALEPELASLIVPRPTAYVLAREVLILNGSATFSSGQNSERIGDDPF